MACTGEKCDRANLCALYVGNQDGVDLTSTILSSFATWGGDSISESGEVVKRYECGPLGDYKWFESIPTVGEEVYLELLPVCKCGTIIRDFRMENHIERKDGWLTSSFGWYPHGCPKCGRWIVGLTVEERYVDGIYESYL